MLTLCGMLEAGYDITLEHLIWRQMKGAFGVNLILARHDFPTIDDAIASLPPDPRVLLIPPGSLGELEAVELSAYVPLGEDTVYCFGAPGENLVRFVRPEDTVVTLTTPTPTDLMAVTMAGILLCHVYG